jgi:threonine/homoserine/homoserine lactone efflux protein
VATVLAFAGVAMIVIATPGPDTALTIRNALRGGARAGVLTAVGVALGQCAWTVLTAVGVAGLLAASPTAFTAVKVLGASYLAFLGVRTLLDARRGAPVALGADPRGGRRSRAHGAPLRQGLSSNLANPKMAAFLPSLLAQFAGGRSALALLGLGLLFASLTLAWLSLYASAVSSMRGVLERPAVRRVLDAITGVALVALAARLLAERRA